jgi:hypothetical protein
MSRCWWDGSCCVWLLIRSKVVRDFIVSKYLSYMETSLSLALLVGEEEGGEGGKGDSISFL